MHYDGSLTPQPKIPVKNQPCHCQHQFFADTVQLVPACRGEFALFILLPFCFHRTFNIQQNPLFPMGFGTLYSIPIHLMYPFTKHICLVYMCFSMYISLFLSDIPL